MRRGALTAMVAVMVTLGGAANAAGSAERVSVSSEGHEANGMNWGPSVSATGRYVAFTSTATNLDPRDGTTRPDVYLRDRRTGATTLISASFLFGTSLGDGDSDEAAISADGTVIAFTSTSDLIVPGDGNRARDVFVHDLKTGVTERVSIAAGGGDPDDGSRNPSLSADGRYVAFESVATDLVPGDTNGWTDVFVFDRLSRQTRRVSVADDGSQGNGSSFYSMLSDDGSTVSFASVASNLTADDAGAVSVYVRDLVAGRTTLVSVNSAGEPADGLSWRSDLSANGRVITFWSDAANLAAGDTNERVDVFVHDRATGQTSRVSTFGGNEGVSGSYWPSISGDGRYVTFESVTTSAVPPSLGAVIDVFVHDRLTGTTRTVSTGLLGMPASGANRYAEISADGSTIVFESDAPNIVAPDLNRQNDIFAVAR